MRLAALILLGGATTAFAQTLESKPAVPPPERPAALNLKLENPSSFANMQPDAKAEPESLPSLGGNARQVPKEKLQPQTPASPYPPDTAPGAR
jgi:hypothetical protein